MKSSSYDDFIEWRVNMKLSEYGRKYNLHHDTIKKGIENGDIEGNKLGSGGWYLRDVPPGTAREAKERENAIRELDVGKVPSTKEITGNLKLLINNEVSKLKALSFSQEDHIGSAHHKNIAILLDKVTSLVKEDNARLHKLDVMNMSDDLLEEIVGEVEKRNAEKNNDTNSKKTL